MRHKRVVACFPINTLVEWHSSYVYCKDYKDVLLSANYSRGQSVNILNEMH